MLPLRRKKLIFSLLVVALLLNALLAFQKWQRTAAWVMQFPPCLEIGGKLHHHFKPNCSGTYTFNGIEVGYSINEHGLRERPAAQLKKGQVLVLGDSMVEGWGLPPGESITHGLENSLGREHKLQFINGAIRSSGPVTIGVRAEELLSIYKPKAAIWFLTENDLLDDRFAYALAESKDSNGVPLTLSQRDFAGSLWVNRYAWMKKYSEEAFMLLTYWAYRRSVDRLMEEVPAEKFPVCAGVERMRALFAKKKVPLLLVAVPMGKNNDKAMKEDLEKVLGCIPNPPGYVDLRKELDAELAHFHPNNTHFSKAGTNLAVQLLQEPLRAFLADIR